MAVDKARLGEAAVAIRLSMVLVYLVAALFQVVRTGWKLGCRRGGKGEGGRGGGGSHFVRLVAVEAKTRTRCWELSI